MLKLYEFPPTRSIRVRWTLQELEVPFEGVTVNMMAGEHRSPEFLSINPAGKVPALVDGEMSLTESMAILLYLAERYPEKGFLPQDLGDRAELYRWLFYTATELEQPLWRIAKHTNLYAEAERLPAEIPLAKRDFIRAARVMEAHMQGREFVVGESVTVGDFALGYTLDWANELGYLADFPVLRAYMERLYQRPHAPMRIREAFASMQGQ